VSTYELETINLIKTFSERQNCEILYLHTKGITNNTDNIKDWTSMMLYFLVDKSDQCIEYLKEYDAVGCNLITDTKTPHFSGNFWWSTSSYIKTLPYLHTTIKHYAEWWLLRNHTCKYKCIHNSNINHYQNTYPSTLYNPNVSKSTCEKNGLWVICSKNPTNILLQTVTNVKLYYPEFDIIIIDSDSSDLSGYNLISDNIDFCKNKNWELGAWNYAFKKYNDYKIYMFIQDSLIPTARISNFNMDNYENGTLYSFHYNALLKDGGYYDELVNIYKDTELSFISELQPNTPILGTAHTSFITNKENVYSMLQLEDAYVDKKIIKNKIHSWLSERCGGLIADKNNNIRIDISPYFKKMSLKRN
jgi:hypothetical protein